MTLPRTLTAQIFSPRCPRCEKGKLLRGVLGVQDNCSECGLVFQHHDSGDGPVFFAITIVGFIVTVAAVVVEFRSPLRYALPFYAVSKRVLSCSNTAPDDCGKP
jgi:uncharacterized protein (DUF983 family)